MSDTPKMKVTIENITPAWAHTRLANKAPNRAIKQSHVLSLAEAMGRGEFRLVPNPICIGADGKLYDGEHRLRAVVLSGKTIPMFVCYGVTEEIRQVIDKGVQRRLGDELTLYRNKQYATLHAAYVGLTAQILAGSLGGGANYVKINTLDAYDHWYNICREGVDWAIDEFSKDNAMKGRSIGGALAFAHKADPVAIEKFGRRLREGLNLKKDDPAFVLREFILKRARAEGTAKIKPEVVLRKVLRAAMADLEGTTLSRLEDTDAGIAYFKDAYADSRTVKKLVKPWTAEAAGEVNPDVKVAVGE